ncbi:MAG: alpha/beta hydrolase [Lachnospiraceae bacterium]|nr:alpha/beta hydrolase [Lachnospiraceae bacterium]
MILKRKLRRLLDKYHQGYYIEKYIINDGKKHPMAIICPGGGYHWVCSFSEGMPYAKKLNSMGYSAFVIHYRCGKGYEYPIPQEDLARAIREILSNSEKWNLIAENYSLWGSSAGGHLAASFGTKKMGYSNYNLPKPGAIILSYPVITMYEKAHQGSRDYLLGKDYSPKLQEMASIEKQITKDYPPVFVWHGLSDRDVDPDNSRLLAEALRQKGVKYNYLTFEGVDHGVGIGEKLACEGWFEQAVDFWQSCLGTMKELNDD